MSIGNTGLKDAENTGLVDELHDLWSIWATTNRRRHEANAELTGAYVRFVLAWGAASLGAEADATSFTALARDALPQHDEVHRCMRELFEIRIEQALVPHRICATERRFLEMLHTSSGEERTMTPLVYSDWLEEQGRLERAEYLRGRDSIPPNEPSARELFAWKSMLKGRLPMADALPITLTTRIDRLAKLDRYKVNRLREASEVLEPYAWRDPIREFERRRPSRLPTYENSRLAFERLVTSRADDFRGLKQALHLVTHDESFGRADVLRVLLAVTEELRCGVGSGLPTRLVHLAATRAGSCDEVEALATAMSARAKRRAPTWALTLRLHADALRSATPTSPLQAASEVLRHCRKSFRPDIELVRACTRMLARTPPAVAVDGLRRLHPILRDVTDSMNTNSHVCVAVVSFIDALVRGYVHNAGRRGTPS